MNFLRRFSRAWLVAAVASGALVASVAGTALAEEQSEAWQAPGPSKARGRKKKQKKARGHSRSAVHRSERRRHAGGRGRAVLASGTTRTTLARVTPSPGPLPTAEAAHAMDQVRRSQIERAESAARRPELTSRWQTVLFLLSGVDEERYPEAGFWRALASYRTGDLEGGDGARRRCQLAARDVATLDGERTVASTLAARPAEAASAPTTKATTNAGEAASAQTTGGLQQAAFVDRAGARPPSGVHNNAPYAGSGPAPGTGLATN